jgi:nucleotide-binding universal stress UspA family protein
MDSQSPRYRQARIDFQRARRQAQLKEIINWVRGKPNYLLPFETVRKHLYARGEEKHGYQRVPLDAIIGSVGRYSDFTRDFLPRSDFARNRWTRVKAAFKNIEEMPPVDLYQIGTAYFVLDGNHRVSIARDRGAMDIAAYVTEIHTKVSLTPDTDLDELILKAEYAAFLEQTNFDELVSNVELVVTVPGQYKILTDQIEQFHQSQTSTNGESITQWFEQVYTPVVKIIRARGILRDFPNRTETDLFVWILIHQERLQQNLGWDLDAPVAATDLATQYGRRPQRIATRLIARFRKLLVPSSIEPGPRPGKFRQHQEEIHAHDPAHLFTHMLLPISGTENSWQALELGLRLAWREEARLLGLHIQRPGTPKNTEREVEIKSQFENRCQEVGVPGEMASETGNVVNQIVKRARLSDLVIIHMTHPPDNHPLTRIESGIRKLIQRCPRPILTVPRLPKKLDRLLVAFNGSPKSAEALYAAAYFSGRWEVPLWVLTVAELNKVKPKILNQAQYYLRSQQISATFIQKDGPIAETILNVAATHQIDLLFMGGYSRPPVIEVVLGSPLDQVLYAAQIPVLICR